MNTDHPPKVSIIVASRNNENTISECLESLFNQNWSRDSLEVIVMDGCSVDSTVEIAKKFPAKVHSLPLNAAAAYNFALKIAQFDIIGFVDADAKVEVEWLKKLVPHLSNSKVAGVSGTIETWNSNNPWARIIGYELKVRYERLGRYASRIATMNLLLKKQVIEQVGGWDENLPSQYDTDFGFRLNKLGYTIVYEPAAKCYHFNRQTLKAYWHQQLNYGKYTAKLYFKHRDLIKGDPITDFGMNLQPLFLLITCGFLILGVFDLLRPLWLISGIFLGFLFFYYVISAFRLYLKFKDKSALRFLILYFIRAFAWLFGALITAVTFLVRTKEGIAK